MGRIDSIFASSRRERRALLMPFVTAGYPSLETTERVLPALERTGVQIVELGIPFSDPIADGPVIAESMHEALAAGSTPGRIFQMVRRLRPRTELGLIAMVSQSIVHRIGPARFVEEAADAGFDGLIIPDLDLADAPAVADLAAARDLSFTLLVAPTTGPDRMREIAALCRGFVYLLARAGLTGERDDLPPVDARVAALRDVTDLPIAVGFGISTAKHVAAVTAHADAAIVGSALVRHMKAAGDPVEAAAELADLLSRGLTPAAVPTANRPGA
jgi:tryptophan synthase alpha chain